MARSARPADGGARVSALTLSLAEITYISPGVEVYYGTDNPLGYAEIPRAIITDENGGVHIGYCVDIFASYPEEAEYPAYGQGPLGQAIPDDYARVARGILFAGYPVRPLDELTEMLSLSTPLTEVQALSATQAALWNKQTGLKLTNNNDPNILSLWRYLIEQAPQIDSDLVVFSVAFDSGGYAGAPGARIGPITLTASSADMPMVFVPVALTDDMGGRVTLVDAAGLPLTAAAPGEPFYARVAAGTPDGSTTVVAERAAVEIAFFAMSDQNGRKQTLGVAVLGLVDNTPAQAALSWSEVAPPPEPPPTRPCPCPKPCPVRCPAKPVCPGTGGRRWK